MLKIDDRLGSFNIAAGEPWIMSVQMRAMQGSAIINWSARRLVLSFYKSSRELVDQIEGIYTSDASGAYFAFVRDGRFSEGLYGQSLQVELAERLQDGRAIISTGPLAIAPSSNGVSSFGSVIGRVDARFTLYFDNAGLIELIEQDLLPYGGTPITPAPVITTPAAISNDGTPQIGESFTGVLPTGTGFKSVTPAWLRGTTVLSTPGTSAYVGDFAGELTFEATILGDDGSTLKSRSTITVTAATAKVTISGTPPTTGQVGTAYSFTPTVANGAGTKTYALTGGPLLAGLTFNQSTGAITGTPTAAGSMPGLVVTVSDSTGSATTAATNVTIAAAASATPFFGSSTQRWGSSTPIFGKAA